MRKTKIQKRVEEIVDQISALEEQLKNLQARCRHKNATEKYGSYPDDDTYWVDHRCLHCKKWWRVYQ